MAKQRITVVLCDGCGRETETVGVRVGINGGPLRHLDLCASCRRPLEKVLDAAEERRPSRTPIARMPLVTLDEVEKRRQTPTSGPKQATTAPETAPGDDNTSSVGDRPGRGSRRRRGADS